MKVHCHHCQRLIGESSAAMTFVGMFKAMHDRHKVDDPRDTYSCRSCGWVTIFQRENTTTSHDWRTVELKRANG